MAEKKKNKWLPKVLLGILIPLCVCGGALFCLVSHQYQKAYDPIDIVERDETYVMPDYPVLESAPTETEAPETNTPETEKSHETGDHEGAVTETACAESETDLSPGVTEETKSVPAETTAELPTELPAELPTETTAPPEGTESESVPLEPQSPETAPAVTEQKPRGEWSVYIRDPIYKTDRIHSDVVNILLLGIDTLDPDLDYGRSDTMMIVSYNKKTGAIKMISLLRDALVPIENHGWNRLNAAYPFGGVGLTVNTVNQLFKLDIHHYAAIDIEGIRELLNRIGYVDIHLTQQEADYYNSLYKGPYTAGINNFSPIEVLLHMRNRKLDSDFGRAERQREVLTAIAQKLLREKTPEEILDLTEYAFTIVGTNIDFLTFVTLATSVISHKNNLNIESCGVPFSDAYTYGWYGNMEIISFDIGNAAERIHKIIYGK